MSKRLGTLQWITMAMAVLAIAITIIVNVDKPNKDDSPYPGLGGDFSLVSAQGPVALQDFRDQVVVMMFGFTYCPDVCPTGLANVAAALNQLDDSQLPNVKALFVSVDPDRDTPARLKDYTEYFHQNIQGITGTKEQIDQVVQAYGGFYQMVPMPESELKYSVDHSSRIYLINKQGQLAHLMFHNSAPTDLAAEIKKLI